jgi:rhodanese-related sulfurtransferase
MIIPGLFKIHAHFFSKSQRVYKTTIQKLNFITMKMIYQIQLLLVGMLVITASCSTSAQSSYKNAPIAQLTKIKNENKAIVIDVRTPAEWQEGVIDGATLFIDFKSSNFKQEIAKLDKSKTYVVYCRSGGRSAGASQVMIDSGFKNVINMEGGIMSWGGKLVKKP